MSLFKKFVELGRVIDITKGKPKGRQGVIVDIIDSNRLLVDGPGIHRQEIKLKDARLTKFKLKVPHNLPVKQLKKRWEEANIKFRFDAMPYAIRLEKLKRREAVTDYGYFQMRHAQHKRSNIIHNAYRTLRSREPRTLARLERDRKHDLAVKLGYKKVKKLTAEQRKLKEAKKEVRFKQITAQNAAKYKKLLESRAAHRAARKEKLAKKAAAGKLKPREKVPKDMRKKARKGKSKGNLRVNRSTLRRQLIDKENKEKVAAKKILRAKIAERRAKKANA